MNQNRGSVSHSKVFGWLMDPLMDPGRGDGLTADHADHDASKRPRFYQPWMGILVFLAVFLLGMFLLEKLFSSGGKSDDSLLVIQYICVIVLGVAAYALVCWMENRRPVELSWHRLPDIWKGLLLGLAAASLSLLVLWAVGAYRITGFDSSYSPWVDLVSMGLEAAIFEEILCRGILFRLFEEYLGSLLAVVLSAVLFGAMHLINPHATVMGAVAIMIESGLLFAAVYMATRNLWVLMGLHFMWNVSTGPVFGSVVSGSSSAQNSWFIAKWSGPEWLTGGQFGIEASIVPIILLGAFSVLLLIAIHQAGGFIQPACKRAASKPSV